MVYSSSSMLAFELYKEDSFRFLKVQLIAGVLGFIGMMCASRFPYQFYERHAKKILLFSLICMLLVFSPFGYSVRSASGGEFSRWLRIGGAQFSTCRDCQIGFDNLRMSVSPAKAQQNSYLSARNASKSPDSHHCFSTLV